MSLKRVSKKNFPYDIKSCDGSMFVNGSVYYVYKGGEWSLMKHKWCGYFDVITDEPLMKVNYIKIECEDNLSYVNGMMSELLAKETEMLTKKMMVFDASTNEKYLPELSLIIAGMCFELGVM